MTTSSDRDPAEKDVPSWRWLRTRLHDREDSEHEQILIRIAIGAIIASILGMIVLFGTPTPPLIICLTLAGFLLLGALGFLLHIIWKPGINPSRRCAAMLLDIGCLSFGMILGGELMVPLYPLFLWVIFGMGFRYGQRYLMISSLIGVLGFGTVVLVSDYWRHQPLLAGSLLLALIALPAYASTLLKRLTEALEQAEEASRAKSRFLATMSHELRTPLNAIFGMSDLLDAERLNAQQRNMVATMRSAGRTLLDLIDDLLDVARIESGRIEPNEDRFDLHETLAVVLRLLDHQAKEKGLDLRASYAPDIPSKVIGVERWLKQILINLIGNAIRFTHQGEVVLAVRVPNISETHAEIEFDVIDTGIGIPEEVQEKIFERFSQADNSVSRRYGGSGLGLSIARQLAEIMKGSLTVRSTVGEGACFHLRLTLKHAADQPRRLEGRVAVVGDPRTAEDYVAKLKSMGAEAAATEHASETFGYLADCGEARAVLILDDSTSIRASAFSEDLQSWFRDATLNQVLVRQAEVTASASWPYFSTLVSTAPDDLLFNIMHAALAVPNTPSSYGPARPAGAGSRVLVAEDNFINQKVMKKVLASGGHSVTLTENGEDLLDKLDEGDFDLVFVDLNMPAMSGLEAVKLHRMGVGTDHPPFVALTADATPETKQACMESGFADYLTKPLEMSAILETVQRFAKKRQPPENTAVTKVIRHPRFADSHAIVDVTYLRKLRALDPDPSFFVEIVNDFIEDADGLITELGIAVEKGDDITYRDRNHALQSSAAYIGGVSLCQLCRQWRNAGPDELHEEGADRVAAIRREFQRLSAELRTMRDGESSIDLEGRG